jgi:hypothetical protein
MMGGAQEAAVYLSLAQGYTVRTMKSIRLRQDRHAPLSIIHSIYLLTKTTIANKCFLKKPIVPLMVM